VMAIAVRLALSASRTSEVEHYDEDKQSVTAFAMVKVGHRCYQHTRHERVATKPPLVGWISAGFFSLTQSWEIAWRLPSFLAAIAMSILLFRFGHVYGALGGLIAMSALAFNLLTSRLAS